mmetsp:Transcript_4203/g.8897  ORF Transcript_4203/g.8897 Transcript_4203/m.8897 type:complete len:254 (-) Transcript_4203:450-1211(-)
MKRPTSSSPAVRPPLAAALAAAVAAFYAGRCEAWMTPNSSGGRISIRPSTATTASSTPTPPTPPTALRSTAEDTGSLHGQNSCFLPLQQLDQDYFAPRVVQIAGPYPGITASEFLSVTSEPSPEQGQWNYDFSDPDGPQVGTVAIAGSPVVHGCDDPAVIVAEHFSIGVQLPPEIEDPVDLIVLADRSLGFAERAFLVHTVPGSDGLKIAAYGSKGDMPGGSEVLGRVVLVQIPWLPSMKPTKSGFMEVDEYF